MPYIPAHPDFLVLQLLCQHSAGEFGRRAVNRSKTEDRPKFYIYQIRINSLSEVLYNVSLEKKFKKIMKIIFQASVSCRKKVSSV